MWYVVCAFIKILFGVHTGMCIVRVGVDYVLASLTALLV